MLFIHHSLNSFKFSNVPIMDPIHISVISQAEVFMGDDSKYNFSKEELGTF